VFWSGLAKRGVSSRQAFRKWGLAVLVASGLLAGAAVSARSVEPVAGGEASSVALATLPEPAQQTYRRVLNGGPFPYAKDGTVFGNRERQLPARKRGHYREYTVKTPGASDRGARRIVCGGSQPTQPESCFYTDDHYASFRRIAP
jgi:ribonuclease T1